MSRKTTSEQLKSYFKTGKKPTEGQFAELIDGCYNAPRLSFDAKTQILSISTNEGEIDHSTDLKGIAPYTTRSWTHGHSIEIDEDTRLKALHKKGWGTEVVCDVQVRRRDEMVSKDQRLILDGSSLCTFHFAVPTPLMADSVRLKSLLLDIDHEGTTYPESIPDTKDKVEVHTGAIVKNIDVYNGRNTIFSASGLSATSDLRRLPVDTQPLVTRAIGLTLSIEYYFRVYSRILVKQEHANEIKTKDDFTRTKFYAVGCEFVIG